jgi:hypothetical protein
MFHCRAVITLACLTLSAAVCLGAAASRPPARELHQGIASILAQPEYEQPDLTWLDKVVSGLVDWLRRLFGGWGASFAKLHEAWPLLYWAIVSLLILALAALLYHIFWTLTTAFGVRRGRKGPAPVVRADGAPEEFRKRAMGLAAEGRFAEALVALHAALIRLLDLRGVLRYDRARTNWEYLDAVRGKAELAAVLRPLTVSLDPVLYGGAGLAEAEYRACEALVSGVWAEGEAAA